MKNIFIWSKLPPFKRFSETEIIRDDLLENNVGNLLFRTAVARALMVDAGQAFYTKRDVPPDLNEAWLEEINSRCACMVLPLANAFRASYMGQLEFITRLIEKLKIPCVVVGVGIQCESAEQLQRGFAFDDTVRRFVNVVLEHSAMLGLRGEFTAAYLEHLGYIPEKHYRVIGCPSMFSFGANLPRLEMGNIDACARVCINTKSAASRPIHAFMQRSCKALPNYSYIPQTIQELRLLNLGAPLLQSRQWRLRRDFDYFPLSRGSALVKEGRVKEVFDADAWIDYMRSFDLTYGCNIHGNIASILAGTPAVVIARDLRVTEIARYFEIPTVAPNMLADKTILDVLDGLDFSGINRHHAERFERYTDFLKANELENIYALPRQTSPTPFDIRRAEVKPLTLLDPPRRLGMARRALGADLTRRSITGALSRRLKRK